MDAISSTVSEHAVCKLSWQPSLQEKKLRGIKIVIDTNYSVVADNDKVPAMLHVYET